MLQRPLTVEEAAKLVNENGHVRGIVDVPIDDVVGPGIDSVSCRGVEFVLTSTGTQKAIVCEDIVGSLYFNTTLTSMLQAIRDLDQLADMLEDL